MSDVCSNLITEKYRKFCTSINKDQTVSSNHRQNSGQVEVCIKFIKHTSIQKYFDTNADTNLAL